MGVFGRNQCEGSDDAEKVFPECFSDRQVGSLLGGDLRLEVKASFEV